MTRYCLLLACLVVAAPLPAVAVACPDPDPPHVPHRRSADENPVISTRVDFDRWMRACPQLLAPLGNAARKRFLDHLEFNENGVAGFPVAELEDALTTEEISVISRRLGLEGRFAGLTVEEAERLRAQPRPAQASAMELKHDSFVRELMRMELGQEPAAIGAPLQALYESLFATEMERRDQLDNHDLALLFSATASTAFHQRDGDLLESAAVLHGELSQRGVATRARSLDMMRLLLGAGQLERARTLSGANPTLPSLPSTRASLNNPPGPAVWDLETGPDPLVQRQIDLSPFHVVARVSLACAFSRAAMEAIGNDPELGPFLREHGTWMVEMPELLAYARLEQWNQANARTPVSVMAGPARWPMLEGVAEVPAFHIFKDGELVDTVKGWPLGSGNRDALLAALERAGIKP